MSDNQMDAFVRDLLGVLENEGVYVLEQTPYDVVVDGTFDPHEAAKALAAKWMCTPIEDSKA